MVCSNAENENPNNTLPLWFKETFEKGTVEKSQTKGHFVQIVCSNAANENPDNTLPLWANTLPHFAKN